MTINCPCYEEPTEADETDVTLLFTDQYYQRALMSDFISLNTAVEEEEEPPRTCEEKEEDKKLMISYEKNCFYILHWGHLVTFLF